MVEALVEAVDHKRWHGRTQAGSGLSSVHFPANARLSIDAGGLAEERKGAQGLTVCLPLSLGFH